MVCWPKASEAATKASVNSLRIGGSQNDNPDTLDSEKSMAIVAGVDLGGTAVNYTFLDGNENFLIEGLCEYPARSREGPDICLQQIADPLAIAAAKIGCTLADIAAVGLDTPGPASS